MMLTDAEIYDLYVQDPKIFARRIEAAVRKTCETACAQALIYARTPAAELLSTCSKAALELSNNHAFVYGRCRLWHGNLVDSSQMDFHWSRYAWWKAMWYPHRGPPNHSESWGVYGGGASDSFTGAGDADLTHWHSMFAAPS